MPEQTISLPVYYPDVECKTREGLWDWEIVVSVTDEKGDEYFLSVSKGMVNEEGGKTYLAIGVVRVDPFGKRVLIELPQESDSGASRLWVPLTSFRRER